MNGHKREKLIDWGWWLGISFFFISCAYVFVDTTVMPLNCHKRYKAKKRKWKMVNRRIRQLFIFSYITNIPFTLFESVSSCGKRNMIENGF